MVCEWLIITVSSFTVWHPPGGLYWVITVIDMLPQSAWHGYQWCVRKIFINDLPNCLSYSIPRMYADDTNLAFTNGDINELNK